MKKTITVSLDPDIFKAVLAKAKSLRVSVSAYFNQLAAKDLKTVLK